MACQPANRQASNSGAADHDANPLDVNGSKGALSRRKIFTRALGVAAAGAAGGTVLTDVFAPSASAATAGTTVEQGAVAPAVVSLTDTSLIAVDASLGNDFRVTLGADHSMANPSNPTDGQKIIFQVTQGTSGSSTITWGSAYEFSTGLPQPTLSTAPGDADLLSFVYNAARSKWLFSAFVSGFGSAGGQPSTTTYRLFPSTSGPSTVVSWTGFFQAGVVFQVTTGGIWFDGYWWWVAASGQSTAPVKFALWQMNSGVGGTLISGSVVTSTTLTAGQWNFVPLTVPVPLAIGATYIAANGYTGNFLDTNNQFGSGDPYSAGIANGPLLAYSDQSGSAPAPFGLPQSTFGTASDPSVNLPVQGFESANFWMDLQIDTAAPSGASYRLWPNYPVIPGGISADTGEQTMGTEFLLSQSCTLDNIWFYSPPGVTVLPSRCAIWDVATQSVVAGTDNQSPSWSGAAGSGWVACAYSSITLPAGDYKTSVYYGGGSKFYQENVDYFSSGPGGNGITAGPLTCPNVQNATPPGNTTYQNGPFSYPDTFDQNDKGETRWVDVEVTPVGSLTNTANVAPTKSTSNLSKVDRAKAAMRASRALNQTIRPKG